MRVGFTASAFDLLHVGHLLMLRECKTYCDYLICALQVDPTIDRPEKNKPIQSLTERHIQLSGVKYVDEIIPYSTEAELEDLLIHLPINVRFIGEEYHGKTFTGSKDTHYKFIYNRRQHNFSSSELRQRIYDSENKVNSSGLLIENPIHMYDEYSDEVGC